jgi:hypothetical protein
MIGYMNLYEVHKHKYNDLRPTAWLDDAAINCTCFLGAADVLFDDNGCMPGCETQVCVLIAYGSR